MAPVVTKRLHIIFISLKRQGKMVRDCATGVLGDWSHAFGASQRPQTNYMRLLETIANNGLFTNQLTAWTRGLHCKHQRAGGWAPGH